VQETVSDEAREDQWGVHSTPQTKCGILKRAISDFECQITSASSHTQSISWIHYHVTNENETKITSFLNCRHSKSARSTDKSLLP